MHRSVIVVGDVSVGKTSLLLTYVVEQFPGEYLPSIADNYVKNIQSDDTLVILGMYDTLCHEQYERIRASMYPVANAFLVCFSCFDRDSFERVQSKWCSEIAIHKPDTPLVLVATKTDLREDENAIEDLQRRFERGPVTDAEGLEMARQIGALAYLETSAVRQEGLAEVFETTVRIILGTYLPDNALQRRARNGQKLSKCFIL